MTDHHFSRSDLATLVGGLDRSGVPFIEVGHGNGLGRHLFKDPQLRANAMPLPQVDDVGHAEVARRCAKNAKIGCLLVAGRRFAPIEYIDRIAELGFAFVRLATMPDEVDDELFKYVRRIKDRGMLASINMMQTYAKPPEQVGELARRAAGHGLDWFYVVDSAGGMMVDEVKRYVSAILANASVEVGLHAHNNLGCAVANTLAAVDVGATLVDGTLNGIGRATGNAATEQLAVALRDRLANKLDLDALVVLGNAVRSLFDDAGNDSFDFISGGALVHSRNVPKVEEAARKRGRSRTSLLLEVAAEAKRRGELNAVTYSENLFDTAAKVAAPTRRIAPSEEMIAVTTEEIVARWHGGARRAVEDLSLLSRQRHRQSVVHVSRGAAALSTQPVPWQLATVLGVTIPWVDGAPAWEIAPEHRPAFVIFDGEGELPLTARHAAIQISFADMYARALQDLVLSLRNRGFPLWCPGGDERGLGMVPRSSGPRPAGAVAIALGEDLGIDAKLVAGDVAIMTGAPARARVDAARRRGARVVCVQWPRAVAQQAHALIDLQRDLAAEDVVDKLASGVQACGIGQSAWDPEYGTVLDADDVNAAANQAGAAFMGAVLAGQRRL